MNPEEFSSLVHQVADFFAQRHSINVSGRARNALIDPGLPHLDDVTIALSTNEISREFLEDCVYTILVRAFGITKDEGNNEIGDDAVHQAMKESCPYLFWC